MVTTSLAWRRITSKCCPMRYLSHRNAPFPYDMAPFGRQWFALQDRSEPARLKGTQSTAPILDHFIDTTLAEHGLSDDKLALIGFSQGTMMSLYVGLRREKPLAGIIAQSGILIGPELLTAEIKSRPPVLLIHGDAMRWCLLSIWVKRRLL